MSNEVIKKIKNTRLARKAQIDSGLINEIKLLQKQIVIMSFAKDFDRIEHRSMMERLKQLKAEHKNIGQLHLV